jgi:hypothetical protein
MLMTSHINIVSNAILKKTVIRPIITNNDYRICYV